jgi:peroxiredoxin
MRSRSFALASLAVVGWIGVTSGVASGDDEKKPAPDRAAVDTPVRDFRLRDVMADEETFVRLSDLKGKTVVLFFVSDKCQVTWLYEERTGKLIQDFKAKGVVFLGIRSSAGDSEREIRSYCEAKNFDIPVLFDEGNVVADYFDVVTTPQYGVIDDQGVLRYFGACDDNQNPAKLRQPAETATKHYVREALEAVLAGRPVTTKEAKGYG